MVYSGPVRENDLLRLCFLFILDVPLGIRHRLEQNNLQEGNSSSLLVLASLYESMLF